MGFLFQSLHLEESEVVRWSKTVGNVQGGGRPVGGLLVFTDRRVAFRPTQYERLLNAKAWSIPLAKVVLLDVVPAQSLPANSRSLLRIHLKDETDQFFNLNGKKKAITKLGELTGLRASDSPQAPIAETYQSRPRTELIVPILTFAFLVAALVSEDWIAWVLVGIRTLMSLSFVRIRFIRRSQGRQ